MLMLFDIINHYQSLASAICQNDGFIMVLYLLNVKRWKKGTFYLNFLESIIV